MHTCARSLRERQRSYDTSHILRTPRSWGGGVIKVKKRSVAARACMMRVAITRKHICTRTNTVIDRARADQPAKLRAPAGCPGGRVPARTNARADVKSGRTSEQHARTGAARRTQCTHTQTPSRGVLPGHFHALRPSLNTPPHILTPQTESMARRQRSAADRPTPATGGVDRSAASFQEARASGGAHLYFCLASAYKSAPGW